MKTTKSALALAQEALRVAEDSYPAYSCPKSPHKFTQPQLVACLVLKEFLRLDYRGMSTRLGEWSDLRQVLGLKRVPHFTTLCAAHKRLFKKPQADRLMDQVIRRCQRQGLLPPKSPLAAIDSTGLESRHVSRYFIHRCQRQKAHWKGRYPKLSAICDTRSHLVLGAVFGRGPKADHCEFEPTVRSAVRRQEITTLVGDAGYDSEPGHRLCRRALGIRSIFPVTRRGRHRHDGQPRVVGGTYRRRLFRQFPKEQYGHRWQIETTFSMIKRLLGSALRARQYHSQCREMYLRIITFNLMILWPPLLCFIQSRSCTFSAKHPSGRLWREKVPDPFFRFSAVEKWPRFW